MDELQQVDLDLDVPAAPRGHAAITEYARGNPPSLLHIPIFVNVWSIQKQYAVYYFNQNSFFFRRKSHTWPLDNEQIDSSLTQLTKQVHKFLFFVCLVIHV